MPRQGTNVFVSYSHADAALVAPVVKLLRLNKSLVFQDVNSIRPGKKWRSEIATGVARSQLVVVFWCDHASHSDEVAKEWKAAIELKKDLLPLLLDATPLPRELSDFQWIDFRGTVGSTHTSMTPPVSPAPARAEAPMAAKKFTFWWPLSFVALAVVLGVALVALFHAGLSPETTVEPQGPAAPSLSAPSPIVILLPWIALVLAALGAILWWRWRSKWRREATSATAQAGEFERRAATEIEAEILRRTSSIP